MQYIQFVAILTCCYISSTQANYSFTFEDTSYTPIKFTIPSVIWEKALYPGKYDSNNKTKISIGLYTTVKPDDNVTKNVTKNHKAESSTETNKDDSSDKDDSSEKGDSSNKNAKSSEEDKDNESDESEKDGIGEDIDQGKKKNLKNIKTDKTKEASKSYKTNKGFNGESSKINKADEIEKEIKAINAEKDSNIEETENDNKVGEIKKVNKIGDETDINITENKLNKADEIEKESKAADAVKDNSIEETNNDNKAEENKKINKIEEDETDIKMNGDEEKNSDEDEEKSDEDKSGEDNKPHDRRKRSANGSTERHNYLQKYDDEPVPTSNETSSEIEINWDGVLYRKPCECKVNNECVCCAKALMDDKKISLCCFLSYKTKKKKYDLTLTLMTNEVHAAISNITTAKPLCVTLKEPPKIEFCAEISMNKIAGSLTVPCLDIDASIASFPIFLASFRCFENFAWKEGEMVDNKLPVTTRSQSKKSKRLKKKKNKRHNYYI